MLEAILQAKTVYGDDLWLFANRPPAVQYLVNGHGKLQTALSLQREVLRLWESVTAKVYLSLSTAAILLSHTITTARPTTRECYDKNSSDSPSGRSLRCPFIRTR